MKKKIDQSPEAAELRQQTEERLSKSSQAKPSAPLTDVDVKRLLHELQAHHFELEMQNEELRRTQVELEASQSRYFDLFDLAPVGYVILSEKGLILEANLAAATQLGETKNSLIKQPLTHFILPEDQNIYHQQSKQLFETGAPQICELRMLRVDMDPFWARLEATVAQDADGAPVCRAVLSDITEYKRAEEALRCSLQETAHVNNLLLALSHASQVVQGALTTEKVYFAIQNQVTQMGYRATGFEFTQDGQSLHITYINYKQELVRKGEKLVGFSLRDFSFRPRADSIFHRVITQGETVFVKDTAQAVADALPKKLRSLARPITDLFKLDPSTFSLMKVGDEMIGILSISGPDLTETDNPAVTAFSQQAAISLQNARLNERTQQEITERKQAEDALRGSEEKWRSLVSASPDYIALHNAEGRYLFLNHYAEGFTEKDIIGTSLYQYLLPESVEVFRSNMEKALNTWTTQAFEYTALGDRGATRTYEAHLVPLRDKNQEIIILSVARDITERKRAEESLRHSENKFSKAFRASPDVLIISQRDDGLIIETNDSWERLFGYSREEVIGRSALELGLFANPADRQNVVAQLQEQNFVHDFEVVIKCKSGKVRQTSMSVEPIEIDSKPCIITMIHDITERKQAEEALRESEEKWRSLVSASPDYIALYNAEGRFLFLNHYAEGFTEKDVIGTNVYEYLMPESVELFRGSIEKALSTQITQHFEYNALGDRGATRMYEAHLVPLRDKSQEIIILCVARDITERRLAEETLRESHQLLERTLASLLDAVFIIDSDTTEIIDCNPAASAIFGYSRQEMLGRMTAFLHVDQAALEEFRQHLNSDVEEKGFLFMPEFRMKRKDGTVFPTEHSVVPLDNEQGKRIGWVSVVRDITERRQAEKLQEAIYRIAQAADKAESLDSLYPSIHTFIREVMVANNFYIALYDEKNDLLSFPYSIDEVDPPAVPKKPGKGLTEYVLRTAKSLLCDDARFEELKQRGEIDLVGVNSPIWLGVPLLIAGKVIGVIAVQDYQNARAYGEREQRILEFVSSQAAMAIHRKRAEQALAQSHEQLRALTAYWQNAIEAERAYIAREIHDEFGQSMTALKMDLTWLTKRLPEGDERVKRVRDMNTLVDDSIALMRRIATELRPNLLDDLGLNAALEWQAHEFSRRSGMPCKLDLPEHDLGLDPALNTTLFRIFQETLTNITRHAQATRVSASLKQTEQTLVLTMRDNGRGISESKLEDPNSLGLLGMRERASQWGGETTIRGSAGKGTTVTVRIPLPSSLSNGDKR